MNLAVKYNGTHWFFSELMIAVAQECAISLHQFLHTRTELLSESRCIFCTMTIKGLNFISVESINLDIVEKGTGKRIS